MVLDSSALLAILLNEPEADALARRLAAERTVRISAASILELHIVLMQKLGEGGILDMERLLRECNAEIVPVTLEQLEYARRAYDNYGKGRHAARLNFGDCFAYALAKESRQALLYKGEDFAKTDISAAAA